jgi:hypothetical protein
MLITTRSPEVLRVNYHCVHTQPGPSQEGSAMLLHPSEPRGRQLQQHE